MGFRIFFGGMMLIDMIMGMAAAFNGEYDVVIGFAFGCFVSGVLFIANEITTRRPQ